MWKNNRILSKSCEALSIGGTYLSPDETSGARAVPEFKSGNVKLSKFSSRCETDVAEISGFSRKIRIPNVSWPHSAVAVSGCAGYAAPLKKFNGIFLKSICDLF